MASERGQELPSGFIIKHLEEIKADFLMPENWFYAVDSAPPFLSYSLTKDSVDEIGRKIVPKRETDTMSDDRKGLIQMGIVVFNIQHQSQIRVDPSEVAISHMQKISNEHGWTPVTDTVKLEQGDLVTVRRLFRVIEDDVEREDFMAYMEFTGNDLTGTAYSICFRCPIVRWEEYEKTARLMIENRKLDPSF